MAQYSQRTQPMHRPGQTEHGHGGGLAYGAGGGGKPAGGGVVQPRAPAQPYQYPPLRLHQPGYGSAALTYARDSGYGRSGVGEYRGGARMSLLGNYLPPPAPPAHHPPPADPPPYKKIRIADRQHHHQLRVDTREPVNTYNTVEVLSPNPPSEPTVEDQSFRTTKDELLQQISKVDREMALSESTLAKLKKKLEELEQTASKPAKSEEPEEAPPRHRSLAQCIYAENRKKAATAHGMLAHLGPPVLYPLYNQPRDTELYHENIRKHRNFRTTLAQHIHSIRLEGEKREDALADAYTRRAAEWMRRVERIEQGQKRKARDAKNREFFEKVFPELRKAREERERFNRLGARVKSEAELEEIADNLHEQEHEDKKMRALTVVPPLLRDPKDRTPMYIDTNRRCLDMEAEHAELELKNVWTASEREMFREKYLQHPKHFGTIAAFLPRKSVRDCVRFYYLSKKAENYKQLLRKPRARRPARGPRPQPEPQEIVLTPGVTTRLQRSQGVVGRAPDSKDGGGEEGGGERGERGGTPPAAPAPCAPHNMPRSDCIRTPPLPLSPPLASSAPPAPAAGSGSAAGSPAPASPSQQPADTQLSSISLPTGPAPHNDRIGTPLTSVCSTSLSSTSITITACPPSPSPDNTSTTAIPSAANSWPGSTTAIPSAAASWTGGHGNHSSHGSNSSHSSHSSQNTTMIPSAAASWTGGSQPATPQPAQPPTPTQPPPTPEAAVIERTGTPSTTITCTTASVVTSSAGGVCAVCSMGGATRTVSRSRAPHYGLKEDAVGARVCEPCHCRCVRSRYTRCPVPTCPGPRVRAKRLRHLPPRWHDLSLELKRPLMDEFQIPSELSKCCLACFKRITRRLEGVGEGPSEPSEEEVGRFRALVRDHGTHWDRMAPAAGKSPASLKAFYFTYRKRFQLDTLVPERTSNSTPVERESDSSVASSGDTDTASAPSPRPLPPAPPPPAPMPRTDAVAPARRRRDEYDSSATETADEENETPTAKIIPSITLSTPVSSSPATPPCSTPATTSSGLSPAVGVGLGRNGPAPAPLTVRDVVLNMIEISLMKNNQAVPPQPKLMPPKVTTSTPRESLATLSVVSSGHAGRAGAGPGGGGAVSPQRPATITPLAQPPQPQPDALKEGVVVLIEPRDRQDRLEPLLDLSVKRPRTDIPQHLQHLQQQCGVKPAYRNSTEFSYRSAERESPNSIQAGYKGKPAGPAPAPAPAPAGNAARPATLNAKPMPNPKGSITLGTPVENRFDARRTPPDPKTGSITAGTPVHGTHHLPEKKSFEYYKRRSPGGAAYYAGVGQPRPQSPSFSPNAGGYGGRPYALDNRQIIMTDYITSQQMHGAARRQPDRNDHNNDRGERQERSERASSPQYAAARREQPNVSVIQRHTPHPAYAHHSPHHPLPHAHPHTHQHQHPHPPPGHEAFTSLVDVASAATALPVPRAEAKPEPKHHQQHPQHQQHQQHPQHHDIRLQERMARDMAMAQAAQAARHGMHYAERDRRQQQPYLDRERHQLLHQNRERERVIAMQERHNIAMAEQQHQNQLIHDRHMQHQQAVAASQESERRLAAANATYSAPHKHRAINTLHQERKDNRGPVVSTSCAGPVASAGVVGGGVGAGPAAGGGGGGAAGAAVDGRPRPTEGTLTAASLIDAIITHQISQSSDQRFPGIIREDNRQDSNQQQERSDRGPTPAEREREQREREREAEAVAAAHTTSIKLGDLASNIITRDFCSPTTSILHHNSRFVSSSEAYSAGAGGGAGGVGGGGAGGGGVGPGVGGARDEDRKQWQQRDPPKHAPYLEPVSPPDNHHNRNNSNRRYGVGVGGVGVGGGVLTAFDYVTTRIVEVMRSDADERAKPAVTALPSAPAAPAPAPAPALPFPAQYAYPYSALNVATPQEGAAPPPPAPPPAPLTAPPAPEPAPLMSAQYEPLSDED